MAHTNEPTSQKPLRLWPGVVAALLLVVIGFVAPTIAPDAMLFEIPLAMLGFLGGTILGLAIVVWWVFFSRAPWSERLGALAVMIVAVVATRLLLHESMAGAGMGMMFYFLAIPGIGLAFVAWALASRHLTAGPRRASMIATILLASGAWALVRTGGISGEGDSDLHWRWTPTPEERLLAQARDEDGTAPPATPSAITAAEWPGFRGPYRDGVIEGVQINTDWAASPPVELWRRPIGPGWSSFAVDGDFVYTQEQRGDDEVVSCYRLSTGEPVWLHRDPVRFYESNAGAGPRGTPSLYRGRVYALGATGILNALDAGNGEVVWSRNAATDSSVAVPDWGVASSPLPIDDLVVVAISGQLVAYDVGTSDQRWLGPTGGAGYSSPHLATLDGVAQVLLLRGSRTISVAPADGTLLWEHVWEPGVGIVQPALTPDGDVLITVGSASGLGIRRLAVAKEPEGWRVEERWTSQGLKPYFNDFVVHEGHAFGFDGSILACIDLADGERKWKGGRYGHGQMVLLSDQDVLLVLSEDGELALVSATPAQFTELARFAAIEGKTWNHPLLVRDVLLVRNGEEMAAFRL